jgi:hypothetical protein
MITLETDNQIFSGENQVSGVAFREFVCVNIS